MGLAAQLKRRARPRDTWDAPTRGPWRDVRFSVIDIETTGLDPNRDEIMSLGVVQIDGGVISSSTYYRVVKPSRPSSATSMAVHAIMPADVANADPLDRRLEEIREVVESTAVVAHAAWIERAFLNRALAPRRQQLAPGLVDTAAIACHLGIGSDLDCEPPLEWLAGQLGLPVHTPHHALGDAFTTAQVLLALISRLSRNAPITLEELLAISAR